MTEQNAQDARIQTILGDDQEQKRGHLVNNSRLWTTFLFCLSLIYPFCFRCQAQDHSPYAFKKGEETMHNQNPAKVADSLSTKEWIVDMVRAAGSHSGVNVGPMPSGQRRLKSAGVEDAIKKWMDLNGESIVGTRGGPFDPTDHYVTTYKDGKTYVHVLSWDGKNNLLLPAVTDRVVKKAWIMGHSEADGNSWGIVRQHPWGLLVVVPEDFHNGVDDIIVLEIEGDAASLEKPGLVEADPSSVIYLFGDVAKVRGELVHLQAQDWIEGWKTQGDSVSWKVRLPQASEYEIAMTYAASENGIGSKFEIVTDSSKVTGTVRQTTGWVGEKQNFEKIPLEGTLHLPAGQSTITLRLTGQSKPKEIMKVHSGLAGAFEPKVTVWLIGRLSGVGLNKRSA